MKVKRVIASLLIFASLLSLAACSSPKPERTSETTAVVTTAEATSASTTSETTTEATTTETSATETTARTTRTTTARTTAETTETTTEAATEETTAETTTAAETWWIDTTAAPSTETRPDHPDLGWRDNAKPYYLKVNTLCNTVTVYTRDANGYHTVPIKVMVCSTGADTPQNAIYSLYGKGKWEWLSLFGNVYGRFATQITGNILFHSVPYLSWGDKSSLKYAEYDKLGTSCSMGCIRLVLSDAIWIYINMSSIAGVEFYSDPDPGPLGKPSAQKISNNEVCRGWDPTDTDPNNPWLTWVETTAEATSETSETTPPSGVTSSEVSASSVETAVSEVSTSEATSDTTFETTASETTPTATEPTSAVTENTTETASAEPSLSESSDLSEPPPAE